MTTPAILERPAYDSPDWIEDEAARNPYIMRGDVVFIRLTLGGVGACDLADWGLIRGKRWCANKIRKSTYAVSTVPRSNPVNGRQFKMHRDICGPGDFFFVDHRNGDGLDNRRLNLRICTNAENQCNRSRLAANNSSGYMGVSWAAAHKKWRANLIFGKGQRWTEFFDCKTAAAKARDLKAIELHGDFASLNFPRSDYEIAQPAIIAVQQSA